MRVRILPYTPFFKTGYIMSQIKEVVDKNFVVVKEYSGFKASLYYAIGLNAYILKVESTIKINDGLIHRASLDLGVEILRGEVISFPNVKTFIVKFLEG